METSNVIPFIADMCIVPASRNGSPISPVNAVRQPSVKAHNNRNGSSCSGKPRASVWPDLMLSAVFKGEDDDDDEEDFANTGDTRAVHFQPVLSIFPRSQKNSETGPPCRNHNNTNKARPPDVSIMTSDTKAVRLGTKTWCSSSVAA